MDDKTFNNITNIENISQFRIDLIKNIYKTFEDIRIFENPTLSSKANLIRDFIKNKYNGKNVHILFKMYNSFLDEKEELIGSSTSIDIASGVFNKPKSEHEMIQEMSSWIKEQRVRDNMLTPNSVTAFVDVTTVEPGSRAAHRIIFDKLRKLEINDSLREKFGSQANIEVVSNLLAQGKTEFEIKRMLGHVSVEEKLKAVNEKLVSIYKKMKEWQEVANSFIERTETDSDILTIKEHIEMLQDYTSSVVTEKFIESRKKILEQFDEKINEMKRFFLDAQNAQPILASQDKQFVASIKTLFNKANENFMLLNQKLDVISRGTIDEDKIGNLELRIRDNIVNWLDKNKFNLDARVYGASLSNGNSEKVSKLNQEINKANNMFRDFYSKLSEIPKKEFSGKLEE